MADRLGRILDPYPIAPSFDHFPSLNAPAPAPLASTHCRQRANVSVWSNLPSVASTGTIFELDEIETFRESTPRRDRRWRCSIKTRRNDRICDLRLLIDISYTGVGVGGGDSSSTPASASSISAITLSPCVVHRPLSSLVVAPPPSRRVVPRPRLSCLRRRSEGTAASPHPSPSRRRRGKIPSRRPPPPPL